MATEVVKRLINVDEYYKMAEVGILKADDRVELINGEIYQMSPTSSEHVSIVNRLSRILNRLFQNEAVISIQAPVRMDEIAEPEPDIAILKFRSDDYVSALPGSQDVLAVIEVAHSSLKHDKEVKTALYAHHGIPLYWIIDIDRRQVEVHQSPDGENYQDQVTYVENDEVQLLGRTIRINEILP